MDMQKLVNSLGVAREIVADIEFQIANRVIGVLEERGIKPRPNEWNFTGFLAIGLYIGLNWLCETSPTGFCVYDHMLDPVHDFCLFCGGPEERK